MSAERQSLIHHPLVYLGLMIGGGVLALSAPHASEAITDHPSQQEILDLKAAAEAHHTSDEATYADHTAYEQALRDDARPKQITDVLKGIGGTMVGVGIYGVYFANPQQRNRFYSVSSL